MAFFKNKKKAAVIIVSSLVVFGSIGAHMVGQDLDEEKAREVLTPLVEELIEDE